MSTTETQTQTQDAPAAAQGIAPSGPAWAQAMARAEPKFKELAAAHNAVTWRAEANFARQAIQRTPKLQQSSGQSLVDAIVNIAAVGLSLSPAAKEAYLVPRGRFVDGKYIVEAHLDISYRGLVKLATDSGVIEWVQAELVFSRDEFRLTGVDKMPAHERNPFSTDRGDFVGCYCVAKLASGDYLTETMTAQEVYQVRSVSTSYQNAVKHDREDSVWHQWFVAMARKTVVRRASKLWPQSGLERFRLAVASLDRFDGSDDMREENAARVLEAARAAPSKGPADRLSPEQADVLDRMIGAVEKASPGYREIWRRSVADRYDADDSALGFSIPRDDFERLGQEIKGALIEAKNSARAAEDSRGAA